MVDASRGTFVSQSYRYQIAEDTSVKALYPNAEILEFDTQLTGATAATLAAAILAVRKTSAQEFEIEIDDILMLEDFEGSAPRVTIDSSRFDTGGRTFRVVSAEIDYVANITKLVVIG